MKKDKHINIFKKEDGAGLVLALMVLMVFAILGIAVAGVTVGSHKLGNISRDSNSAYYIAEAGANLAYEGIKNGVMPVYTSSSNDEAIFFTNIAGLIADFNPKEYAEETFETQFGDQPKATITISDPKEKDGGKLYTITSIGEVDGKSRKVEKEFLVKFVPTTYDEEGGEWDFSGIPVNTAAVVKNKVNLIDGNIKGDVRFSSLKAKTFVFSSSGNLSVNNVYTTYSGELKDIFDMPQWMLSNPPYDNVFQDDQNTSWETYSSILSIIELPLGWQDYPLSGDIIISGSQENVTKKDHSFRVGTISITGSASLVIDNSVRDINIIVDHFTLEGDTKNPRFEFTGDRQVNLFVRDSLKLGSACHLNRNGVTSQFRLFYMGNKNIPHPGTGNLNAMINGSLIVKEVDLVVSSGMVVNGAIISGGNKIEVSGGATIHNPIVMPSGKITISGGGTVIGTVITEELESSGSGSLIYSHSALIALNELFPGSSSGTGSGSSGSAPTLDNLISAGPALEP